MPRKKREVIYRTTINFNPNNPNEKELIRLIKCQKDFNYSVKVLLYCAIQEYGYVDIPLASILKKLKDEKDSKGGRKNK